MGGIDRDGKAIAGVLHPLVAAAKAVAQVLTDQQPDVEVAQVQPLGTPWITRHVVEASDLQARAAETTIRQPASVTLLPATATIITDEHVPAGPEGHAVGLAGEMARHSTAGPHISIQP